eukprot:31000-Rhodomonas_salina.1
MPSLLSCLCPKAKIETIELPAAPHLRDWGKGRRKKEQKSGRKSTQRLAYHNLGRALRDLNRRRVERAAVDQECFACFPAGTKRASATGLPQRERRSKSEPGSDQLVHDAARHICKLVLRCLHALSQHRIAQHAPCGSAGDLAEQRLLLNLERHVVHFLGAEWPM